LNTSTSKPNDFSLLLPWYVNGTLDASERIAVEQHLSDCHECREAIAQLRQIARAVEKVKPIPLVPEPPVAGFLEKALATKQKVSPTHRMPWWSVAASVLVIIAASYWLFASVPEANVFQTVTDPGGSAEIAYVFDIDTSVVADEAVRVAIAESFTGGEIVQAGNGLRLTVSMPSATMKELNEFAELLRQIDGVQRVEIIGVQLPLE
jgi:hypothetical protein